MSSTWNTTWHMVDVQWINNPIAINNIFYWYMFLSIQVLNFDIYLAFCVAPPLIELVISKLNAEQGILEIEKLFSYFPIPGR